MKEPFYWSILLHLGGNMWNEEGNTRDREHDPYSQASPVLRFSRPLWRRYLNRLKDIGVNMILLDLGEGLRYETHPELAVEGSWTREEMLAELRVMREMGFEVVPKLNFSACHDIWMKEYSRMLSTSVYYRLCSDLIGEVCEIFRPKYFHLGMDEENALLQRAYEISVIRQHDLWWHDLYFLVDCVEKADARAWIWSDYVWDHREAFLSKMPKSVVQSNWYYTRHFRDGELNDRARTMLECFEALDKAGFDQVPTGSNCVCPENMELLTKYCAEKVSPEHLTGFMQTPWILTVDFFERRLNEAADGLAASKEWWEKEGPCAR